MFPASGSQLDRYACRLTAVEINSSFYRPHRPQTYARWAASVPDEFRFAVKAPREITHERRLIDTSGLWERFLAEVGELGAKRGPILIQLPPSLSFDRNIATAFFSAIRVGYPGDLVCEPRHPTWFHSEAEQVLSEFHVARVAADPALTPTASTPGGWGGLVYHRLHGSPRIYYSAYSEDYEAALAETLRQASASAETWCIFDNTAMGAATVNAIDVLQRLEER